MEYDISPLRPISVSLHCTANSSAPIGVSSLTDTTGVPETNTGSFYRMVVIATEQLPEGTVAPVKSDSADLIIYIRDINDNAPVCGVFVTAVDIEPELELGSMIINLNCSDADTGLNANISYSLEDSYGILDVNSNGILFLANPLEQANRTALNVRIQATDMGSPSLSTEVNILIRILCCDTEQE